MTKRGVRRQAKHREILEAARKIFLANGYAATTMDEITRAAGGSKATVYGHFENKEALFSAMVQERCRTMLKPLRQQDLQSGDPRSVLTALAIAFVSRVLKQEALALYRVVLAEAPRAPGLGRVYYERGPRHAVSVLSEYLRRESREGRLSVDDPAAASEQFFGMLLGFLHARALLCVEASTDKSATERHVARTIDTFMRAYSVPAAIQARDVRGESVRGSATARHVREKRHARKKKIQR